MNRLVVIGSFIADQMMTVPHLPVRGGDVLAGPIVTQPGGAFNIAAAAARLGMPTAVLGRIGSAPLGRMLGDALRGLGIEALLPPVPGESGTCLGFIEPDGERTFVTSPGVEQELTLDELAGAGWRAEDSVYLSGYDLVYPVTGPAVVAWLEGFRPARLLLDPGPLIADLPASVLDPVLAATTVLSLNERELALLGDRPERPLGLWRRLAPDAVVVARVGADGAWVHRRGEEPVLVPSVPVAVVDSTGAGDAHSGALLAELGRGLGLVEAVRRANAAGSVAVSRMGSAAGPTRQELEDALRS